MKVVGIQVGEVTLAGRSRLLSWTVRTVLLAQPPWEGTPSPMVTGQGNQAGQAVGMTWGREPATEGGEQVPQ